MDRISHGHCIRPEQGDMPSNLLHAAPPPQPSTILPRIDCSLDPPWAHHAAPELKYNAVLRSACAGLT